MTKQLMLTVAVLTLALLAGGATFAQAQGYNGVLADDSAGEAYLSDDAGEIDLYNPNRQYSDEIYSPDWAQQRAARDNESFRASLESLQADREAATQARAAEAEQIQGEIDARVDAAVSATDDYSSRIDGLKAPPPQLPPDQQPVVVTPETQPGTGTGTDTGTVTDRDDRINRDGSVLDRMMNALQ